MLVVRVKRAFDFKEGDAGIARIKKGSADPLHLCWVDEIRETSLVHTSSNIRDGALLG